MKNAWQGIRLLFERAALNVPRLLVSFVMFVLSVLVLFIVSRLRR